LHPTNLVSRPCADKMPAGKISRFAATRPWAGGGNVRKPIVRPQISTVCSSQRRRGWLWSAALAASLFRRGSGAAINAMRVLVRPQRCQDSAPERTDSMADRVVPHFHNTPGVAVIEIGAREFMCEGEVAPFDHPHVYLDMGDATEIICPYCSTLFRHDPTLDPHAARPPECALADGMTA
jgi:uncharacterized Zn-finger protein